jgi:hypothetical protein
VEVVKGAQKMLLNNLKEALKDLKDKKNKGLIRLSNKN